MALAEDDPEMQTRQPRVWFYELLAPSRMSGGQEPNRVRALRITVRRSHSKGGISSLRRKFDRWYGSPM